MPRTLSDYRDLIVHALGGTPEDTAHDLTETVNDAGRALMDGHPWYWRQRLGTIDFTADVETAPLPADFGEMIALHYTSSAGLGCELTDLQSIQAMRSEHYRVTRIQYGAVRVGVDQAAPGDLATAKVLELYPTPVADEPAVLTAVYRVEWQELVNDEDAPNIHRDWERALILLARAMALDLENQTTAHEWQAYQVELERLKGMHARRQVHRGRFTGRGVRTWTTEYYPHDVINASL